MHSPSPHARFARSTDPEYTGGNPLTGTFLVTNTESNKKAGIKIQGTLAGVSFPASGSALALRSSLSLSFAPPLSTSFISPHPPPFAFQAEASASGGFHIHSGYSCEFLNEIDEVGGHYDEGMPSDVR